MTTCECSPTLRSPRYWLKVSAVNLAAATVAALLIVWLRSKPTWPNLVNAYEHSLVYAFVIGTLASLSLPYIATLAQRYPVRLQVFLFVAALAADTAIGALVGGLLLKWAGIQTVPFWDHYVFVLRFGAVITLTFGLSTLFYETLRVQLERSTLEQERARKLLAEARLSSLEARIHPHFLFNTLNSIASLIPDDPRRAEDMVTRLATLLRFSLDAGQRSLVPLAQEIRVVADYLAIEGARFGERLRYSIDVPSELESVEVPPLSVQTLVENSVKHAIALQRGVGEIRLTARAAGDRVEIDVADSGPGFDLTAAIPGHGLDNLQSRLAALFGDAARLETLRSGPLPAVRLAVPS